MAFEFLSEYSNLIVDYSIIREFGGTTLLLELMDQIAVNSQDVYVSGTFKILHYCVIHQADPKDDAAVSAMKDFCSRLLPLHKLHSVQTTDTVEFLKAVAPIENSLILCSKTSIFSKRIREKKIDYPNDICVLSSTEYAIFHGTAAMIEEFRSRRHILMRAFSAT